MTKPKTAWQTYTPEQFQEVMSVADEYIEFLSKGKTERRCVKLALELAKGFGYQNINDFTEGKKTLKPQDKVYFNMMNKALVLFHIGDNPLEDGLNILGAHIDSPRIDLKQNPLYEQDGICLFDTHYYGGIKKYQWTTIPLSLYGVVCLKDGTHMDVAIGDHEEDEVFVISDLLAHLSHGQLQKSGNDLIEGELMNVTVGSIPLEDVKENPVKANILKILKDRYGIDEEDFISAELEVVPQGKACTCGLDRSMILGYGQDDRVCAYTSLMAMLETANENRSRTSVCLLVDKEEIGSVGATSMKSQFFENILAAIMDNMGEYSELKVRKALQNSTMLSSDVVAAHDPNYAFASSPNNNMAVFGGGICFAKYTGVRGKAGSNDARAEYLAALRKVMDENNVFWQTSELGKVDQGGGGTIAYILAGFGMDVIDCGVPLHNMHAPYELSSKADVYEALKCYKAFIRDMDTVAYKI